MKSYLTRKGWGGQIKTVGFYRVDGDGQDIHNCDVNFYSGATEGQQHQSICNSYFFSSQTEGTNNQDLKNLGCQLAWYIYDNYTQYGLSVRIVAHSMGGMIVRWALHGVSIGDTNDFPPILHVPEVVTIATPHGGIPDEYVVGNVGTWWACGNCVQALEMDASSSNADFIGALNADSASNKVPGGWGYGTTDWTLLGSVCDSWTGLVTPIYPLPQDPGVAADSAMNLPGISGTPGTHKFDYLLTPGSALVDPPATSIHNCYPGSPPGETWGYTHNDYLHDNVDTSDSGYQGLSYAFCNGCNGAPSNNITGQPHALQVVYNALNSYSLPIPAQVVNVSGGGQFYSKWVQYGGVTGEFGLPTGNWYAIASGRGQEQDFSGPKCGSSGGGHMYYSSASGTWEVHGCVATFYLSTAIGGPTGVLGFPTSDETPIVVNGTQIGVYNKFVGSPCGSSSYGHIWFNGGGHETNGCIEQAYLRLGGPTGFLGFPTSNEYGIAGGRANDFAGGTCGSSGGGHIYKLPTTNAYEVHGCIATTYLNIGGPGSMYGFPITDEFTNPRTGWRESDFQNGCIVWNSTGGHGYLYTDAYGVKYCASA